MGFFFLGFIFAIIYIAFCNKNVSHEPHNKQSNKKKKNLTHLIAGGGGGRGRGWDEKKKTILILLDFVGYYLCNLIFHHCCL